MTITWHQAHGKFRLRLHGDESARLKAGYGSGVRCCFADGGSPVCESFKRARNGVTVQHQVAGVTVPHGLLYLSPPGIALDNMWMAPLSVQQRGLMGVTPQEMFDTARSLALRQSIAWLQTLETQMKRVGNRTLESGQDDTGHQRAT
jgi:hypothetical protein